MRIKTLLLLLFVLTLWAEEPKLKPNTYQPAPEFTVSPEGVMTLKDGTVIDPKAFIQLRAEVESLKAQLAQLQTTSAFEMRLCNAAVLAAREFVVGSPQQPKKPNQLSQAREKTK